MKIRKLKLPSGNTVYQLDLGLIKGKRTRKNYPSKADAERAKEDRETEISKHGRRVAEISDAEVSSFLLAREELQKVGASLPEAVAFFLKHGPKRQATSLINLKNAFLDAKSLSGSGRYYKQLKVSLHSFVDPVSERPAHEISKDDITQWLARNQWAAKTQNNYLGDVAAMFNWGIKQGYLALNPCVAIEKKSVLESKIGTLTLEQSKELLEAALCDNKVMGFLVLGLFGGLRPAEVERLDWEAVNLEEGTVIISGSQAKTRQRRVVDLTKNAIAWINKSKIETKGKITGAGWEGRWMLFRRLNGWDPGGSSSPNQKPAKNGTWPHNALRHTYASMHYAHHQNEAALQVQMGHESAVMLHRHYRAVKTKKEAAAFWNLKPE